MIFQDAGLGGVEGTKPPKEAYVPPHLRGKSGGAPPPDSGKYFTHLRAPSELLLSNWPG